MLKIFNTKYSKKFKIYKKKLSWINYYWEIVFVSNKIAMGIVKMFTLWSIVKQSLTIVVL